MSFDVGAGGVAAAIPQDFAQPTGMNNPAALAQQFEANLFKASETAAVSTKQMEEAHLKAMEVDDRERKLVEAVPEIKLSPSENGGNLENRLMDYMESFHERTKNFSATMTEVSNSFTQPATKEGVEVGGVQTTTEKSLVGTGPNDTQVALQMLEKSFAFAIETTLVSKASSESTRIFNNLLKGQ